MSFGWSVGDLMAGANLTYTLIKHLSDTQGACIEYQEAINELGSFQHAFLRIDHIRMSTQVDTSVLNGATYLVTSSMGMIEKFLQRTKKYRHRLGAGTPGSMISSTWLKVGWTLFTKDESIALKVALNSKLTSSTLLLTTAKIYGDSLENNTLRKYQVDSFNFAHDSGGSLSPANNCSTPQSKQGYETSMNSPNGQVS